MGIQFKASSVTVQFKDRNRQSVHHYQSEVPSTNGLTNSIQVTYNNTQVIVSEVQYTGKVLNETTVLGYRTGKTSIYELSDVHAVQTDRMEKLSNE